jgi:hypothetical protein
MDFREELEHVINRHSMENGSNTPDFILASLLHNFLCSFDHAVKERDKWYGVELAPGKSMEAEQTPPNNRSDEIAWLQSVVDGYMQICPGVDRMSYVCEKINERIAQLRAC